MPQGRLYVLVNTLSSHPKRDFLLCDKEGEIYASLADALAARNLARSEFNNPWIQVFRLQDIDASDLEPGKGKLGLASPGTGGDQPENRRSKDEPQEITRFRAQLGAKN